MNTSYNTIDGRQSYVTKSGDEWEVKVMNFVNEELKSLGSSLSVIRGRTIRPGSTIWQKLCISPDEKQKEKIWGDIDLVVIDKDEEPVGIISCKTSLHGRFSETLFYALVLKKQIPGLKVVFATPDKGRQSKANIWQSEWGNEEKPTKDRLLASYLDSVYILNEKTRLGGKIKRLAELPKDLIRWRRKSSLD